MFIRKSTIVRTITAGAVAASLLFGSAALHPVYGDGELTYETHEVVPFEPISPFVGMKTVETEAEDVILDDFTPVVMQVYDGSPGRLTGGAHVQGGGLQAADDFKAGPGCSIQCITSGVAYARNAGAKLVVKTDTAAQIWIIVWTEGYTKMVSSPVGQYEFGYHFDDLEAGTEYDAMAIAVDGQGYSSNAFGSFETLNRYVQISFSGADIQQRAFEDSIFTKMVWVEGEFLPAYEVHDLEPQGSSVNWGNNQILVSNTDRYLDLAVQLDEFDVGTNDICEVYFVTELTLGPGSCDYYAYAELQDGDNDLDERPGNATSWTEHTLQRTLVMPSGALPPGYGSPLLFTVNVELHVIYQ